MRTLKHSKDQQICQLLIYINEFERRHKRIKAKEMELPDGVLAYRLLKSANISKQKQTLAHATISKLTFDEMKQQIKAIYDQTGDSSQSSFSGSAIEVEPTYHGCNVQEESETAYNKSQNFSQKCSYRRSHFGAQKGTCDSRGRGRYPDKGANKRNPLNHTENTTKCTICHSILHWDREYHIEENKRVSLKFNNT